MKLNNKLIYY